MKKGREMLTCKVGSNKDDASVEDRDAAGDAAFVACGVHDATGHSCGAPDLAKRQHGLARHEEEDDADELLRADADVHVGPHGLRGTHHASVTSQDQKRRPRRAGAIIVQCEIVTLCTGTFKNASAAAWVSGVTQSMPSDDAFRSTASWNASATREASCNWTSCASCVKCSGCCGMLPATFHVRHMMFKSNRSAHFDRRRCSAPSTHDLGRPPPLIATLGGAVGAALLASEDEPLQSYSRHQPAEGA